MDLRSQREHPPVLSALRRFTAWFGMDQRGSAALSTHPWRQDDPPCLILPAQLHTASRVGSCAAGPDRVAPPSVTGGKPSTLRTRRLHMSPCVQRAPPVPVISWGSYQPEAVRAFILRHRSHLDAFSGSGFQT